jgi:adenosylcobinamide-phosphate synthase
MAGAFDLALGGPRRYGKELVAAPWIGTGRAKATLTDITLALYLLVMACFLEAGGVVALLVTHG